MYHNFACMVGKLAVRWADGLRGRFGASASSALLARRHPFPTRRIIMKRLWFATLVLFAIGCAADPQSPTNGAAPAVPLHAATHADGHSAGAAPTTSHDAGQTGAQSLEWLIAGNK